MIGDVLQLQQMGEFWKKAMEDQLARAETLRTEAEKMQAATAEQIRTFADEYTKLTQDAVSYATSLHSEWRKAAFEATKRALTMFPGT